MYRGKRFRTKSLDLIRAEIAAALAEHGPGVRRVFLADGDAMCLSAARLAEVLDLLDAAFPRLQRVGIYANARDVLAKSDEALGDLRQRKLKLVYMGLESGDATTLEAVDKGATPAEIVTAAQRAKAAGMSTSVMVLIGLAGAARRLEHARRSADAINAMAPNYTALLTYTPTPDSRLAERIERGTFTLPSARESIEEIVEFVEALTCETYFTCNHASNYVPLVGRLPRAQLAILANLRAALAGSVSLKPEWARGL
jgi:radical SAM superfamily enzyme YgiQ (UPF0313 family)